MNQKLPETIWSDIRLEYQTSKTTCRELALKYGINRETISSRCKLEKWRYGRQEQKNQRRESPSQLGCGLQVLPSPDHFNQRILGEAALWLDRIQEAYETEVKYDRIEAIQKLLPQWKLLTLVVCPMPMVPNALIVGSKPVTSVLQILIGRVSEKLVRK